MTTHRVVKGCKEFLIRFQLHHLLIAIKFVRRNLFAFCLLKVNLVMTFNNHTKFQKCKSLYLCREGFEFCLCGDWQVYSMPLRRSSSFYFKKLLKKLVLKKLIYSSIHSSSRTNPAFITLISLILQYTL